MFYKENQEDLFKEKYHSLDISTITPDDLVNFLEDGKAILALETDAKNKCQLRSYALVDGEITEYIATYKLSVVKSAEEEVIFKSDDINVWRNEFAKDEAYITEDIGYVERLGNDKQVMFEKISNKKIFISEAFSSTNPSFAGSLEVNFIELWLSINKDYYI